jgi:DNA polymerase III subunit gamma/tau
MDKFIVSARKYRPQAFDTVVGQSHITTTLKNAIRNNQLAHAFLFCGPRGVGKTTCARILAKTINCTNLQSDGEACDECNSCKSFNDGISMNIHELDAASNNSVDDIRSLVEQVRFAPQAGRYKVYIVDEVHMLSQSAFNAFLKTLEEPPPYAIFILATTEKHKILPTILSRCQIFDFKRITLNDTVQHLQEIVDKENINADKASLQLIAQKSEGCMRDALSILDKIVSFTNGVVTYANTLENLNILDADYYFKMLDALMQQDLTTAMLLYDEINYKGFEGDMVLNGFAEFIRNILVCKDERAASLLEVVVGMEEKYKETAKRISPAFLVSALNVLNESEINYKMARNKRLHVEMTIIKLNYLQQAIELVNDSNYTAKKKRVDTPVAIHYKPIFSVETVRKPTGAKLSIETAAPAERKVAPPVVEAPKPVVEAAPVTVKTITPVAPATTNRVPTPKPKMGLLEALQEKVGNRYNIEVVQESKPLDMESLTACWKEYADHLAAIPAKISCAAAFRDAQLEIIDEMNFQVMVKTILHQRFIDGEKMYFADNLIKQFNNRAIKYSVKVLEGQVETEVHPMYLGSRQRFERIAENYPLLYELKERLRLEIDIM